MSVDNLEKQVEEILQKDSWQILPNAYYTDPNTKIPREKDTIATSPQFEGENILGYNVRLFIECKHFAEVTEIHSTGSYESGSENTVAAFSLPFARISELEQHKKLHFCDYNKIFGSKDSKDYLYKAVNQNLQSFSAFRHNNSERAVYYLIVIFDGELFSVDQNQDKKLCTNALIKVNTLDNTFNLPNNKCFIELVSISKFDDLIKRIRTDIKEINSSVRFYYRMHENRMQKKKDQIRNDSCK